MPSTPDSILRLELQATGENATTWGAKTNNSLELLGQAIAGAANVNVGGSGNYTLVASNYITDEARAATLVLTGTLSGNRDVIVPSSPKHYTIINQTSGAFSLTIRQLSGTGVAIPVGSSQIVCTSTTCVALNYVSNAGDTMTGALGVVAGTAAAPGVFVSGDTNTGLFQPSADTLAITVGGVEVGRFGANGLQSASPWVDLASAVTTDLGAQTTDNLRITGTTTITSFGTAANGVTRRLRFAGALTLTHNATSLILPGGANITTAAGDTATAISLGGGNWVLTDFQRAATLPFLNSMATARLLGRTTAGSGALEELSLGSGLSFASGVLQSALRAWVNFNGTGAVSIRASENVSSITDNGTGDYTVNLNFTMPDVNYGFSINGAATNSSFVADVPSGGMTTTSFRINTRRVDTRALEDSSIISVTLIR